MIARRLEHFERLLRAERRRIEDSPHDYGICVQCGRPIPDARLELLPATRICGR